jgi:hypothetical protein
MSLSFFNHSKHVTIINNFDVPTAAAATKAATSPLITLIHLQVTHPILTQLLPKFLPPVAVIHPLQLYYNDFQIN